MATRPVFVPDRSPHSLIAEVPVDFQWHSGMAASQKRRNIAALHTAAKSRGLHRLLEISTKSDMELGRRLSAFSLRLPVEGNEIFLESAYQGSKIFRNGGPYSDIFMLNPREAKREPRLQSSGELIGFEFMGTRFPLSPKNAFYDWIYIRALLPHWEWILSHVSYDGYTDIEYNPAKSINCQARAFAEFVALSERGKVEQAATEFEYFATFLSPI
jgi:hypothetical protein